MARVQIDDTTKAGVIATHLDTRGVPRPYRGELVPASSVSTPSNAMAGGLSRMAERIEHDDDLWAQNL